MEANRSITLVEVGPRDGFQNIRDFIPTEIKLTIIRKLLDAGVSSMQLTSFVSPKAVPQMADAKVISETILAEYPNVEFDALVPNLYGAKAAAACGYKKITNVISVSESHNLKNINRTHEQSLQELEKILQEVPDIEVTVGLSTSFGCPFEGETPIEKLRAFIEKIYNIGIRRIELGDTIGVAYPVQVEKIMQLLNKTYKDVEFGVHIHDTRNMGIVSTWVAIQNGVSFVHSTVGGLGGCPFAPGASGNTCTEDLVYMLDRCGVRTGISFEKMMEASRYTKSVINGNYSGHHINIQQCSA
ncbi:MAG: hydroxymethylglutaryl-CoA lyase [Acetivibrionales bacterium]|jgi:hydroxymethylglutaryl-CoA lyase